MSLSSFQDVPDLHVAIRKGDFQEIRCLVSSGVDVNVKDGADHRTPLMLCALIDQEDWGVGIARMLLARGAMVGYADRRGQNALMFACIHGRFELVKVFLKAVDYDPSQRDRFGNTALFYAASNGNQEVVEALVESLLHFKLNLDKANKWGMTPLLEACRMGHEAIEQLLEKHGASVDAKDAVMRWGPAEWRRDYQRRAAENAPRRKSYDKPWVQMNMRNMKRSVSLSSIHDARNNLPSISNSSTSNRSELDDDVFVPPPTIIVSPTKGENATTEPPLGTESRSLNLQTTTASKRRMLFKPWIKDLAKGEIITAVFSPAPATASCLLTQTAPNGASTFSLSKQRIKTKKHKDDLSASSKFQNSFKQIFQRYEIQSSGSFRQRAKIQESLKKLEIQPECEQVQPKHGNAKLIRQQSRMNVAGNSRLSSSSSSLDLNSGRKMKTGDLRARATERVKIDDAASSSSEESAAARLMMNAFRKRKGSVAPPGFGDK